MLAAKFTGYKVIGLFLLIFLFLLSSNGLGQVIVSKKPAKFTDRLFYGGAVGLMIGDVTQIDVIPIGGIWVFPQWSLGVGGRYSYYSHRGYFIGGPSQPYRTHIWGGSFFTQILPVPDISEITNLRIKGGVLFHFENERLYVDRRLINDPFSSTETGKSWVELYLVGFGFRQRLGEKAALNIMFLWEVSNSGYSPYPKNPILRVNFTL